MTDLDAEAELRTLAYEKGYADGESSVTADWHAAADEGYEFFGYRVLTEERYQELVAAEQRIAAATGGPGE